MKAGSLSRRDDFRRVYDGGRRTRRDGIGVAAFARGDGAPARVGFTVRVSAGGAVTRNRIKRRLRAAIATVDLAPGFDLVISGDASVAAMDFQVLVEQLNAAVGASGARR